MRKERSPMLRQVEPKPKHRTGFMIMILFIAIYILANIVIYHVKHLPIGWQLVIVPIVAACGLWLVYRRVAKANGLPVGEYICQMFTQSGKMGL